MTNNIMPISQSNSTNSLSTELVSAINALRDKKAENIRLLDVSYISSITDYIVLATGTSDPHLKAMKSELDDALKTAGVFLIGEDRDTNSGWVIVDAFDFMVHLQTDSMRSFYNLDHLWKDANEIDISSIK
jgi:ribosome-associated protein